MQGKSNNHGRNPPAGDSNAGARAARPAVRNRAPTARERVAAALTDGIALKLEIVDEKPGFNPYDSGTFDRKHAWARISRR
jgi:hypothetical protein